jgi:hypothetical protein
MTNVALHLRWAGRGLAARVVYDAHDLAHAAAAAGIHWGTPVSDDRLRLRTAALAEHFSDGRHKRPASSFHVPLPWVHMPWMGNLAQKGLREPYGFPGSTPCKPCAGGEAKATRAT